MTLENRIEILEKELIFLKEALLKHCDIETERNKKLLMNYNSLDQILDNLYKSINNIQTGLEDEGFLS